VKSEQEAENLTKLLVDIGDRSAAYTVPGQFIQIKVRTKNVPNCKT